MKAFVTGGTGVVGKAFLPRLAQAGYEVTALTRDPDKAGLTRDPRISYQRGDLDVSETMARLMAQTARYDVIFHLAASLDYYGQPAKLHATNAGGTAAMARFARHVGARRFVHASSIEAGGAFARAAIPAGPNDQGRLISAYGASKRAAENSALALNAAGIPAASLRIGNVYGDGWNNFPVEFANAILQHGRLAEWLPHYAHRYWSPVHTDDVASGLLAAAASSHAGRLNLVGPAATVGEMFRLCADAVGVPLPSHRRRWIEFLYLQVGPRYARRIGLFDTLGYIMAPAWPRVHRCFGMDESARILKWNSQVSLAAGIRRTIAWAKGAGLIAN